MSGFELESDADLASLVDLHTTAQIEERFRKVFKRGMTPEERHAFFMPDHGSAKS